MKQKRLGIFIPIELIQNEELDWVNKVLLSEIISLSKLKKGCVASNETLSKFLQIQKSSIHRRIKFLVDNGYINTINKFSGGKCIGRIIISTGKLMVAKKELMVARSEGLVAHATINGSNGDHSMVAQSDPMNSYIKTGKTVINSVIKTEVDIDTEVDKLLEKFNLK